MLRFAGQVFLVTSVALLAYDVAIYLKGNQFLLTTPEQLWNLLGGQRLFEPRSALISTFGEDAEIVIGLPAVTLTFSLGLVLAWLGPRSGARPRDVTTVGE